MPGIFYYKAISLLAILDAAKSTAIVWALATQIRPIAGVIAALWLLGEDALDLIEAHDAGAQRGWSLESKDDMVF